MIVIIYYNYYLLYKSRCFKKSIGIFSFCFIRKPAFTDPHIYNSEKSKILKYESMEKIENSNNDFSRVVVAVFPK